MASRSAARRRAAAARQGGRPAVGGEDRSGEVAGPAVIRYLSARQHRTAAALLALFVLAYLWPVLVGGKVLSPTALLFEYAPWRSTAPSDLSRWVNPELGDVPFSYYPWDVLARRLIHAGTFPAWNPFAFGGTQLWANPEVAWLSPFSLPLWIFSLNWGLGLAAALKLWMAGFGTYLLARELQLGFWAGIVAALGFTLCAFNVVWLGYGVFISVAALLPWALWLAERVLQRGSPAAGLGLVATVAAIQFGGHPGTQVHVVGALVLYACVRAVSISGPERDDRLRRLALIGGAIGLGTMLSAVAILPAQSAATDTLGAASRRNGAPGIPGSSMPFHMLRTALFPDWWGRPGDTVAAHAPKANYRERTFYAGTIVLLLAGVAVTSSRGWSRKAPFAVVGAIGAAVAVHVGGIQPLVVHLPFFDRVQDQRMALWFELSLCVLAAFGLQSILNRQASQRRAWAVLAVGALVALVAIASLSGGGALSKGLHYFLHRSGTRSADALALASVLWWSVLVLALAAILAVARWVPRARLLTGALVALVLALDMLHFAHGYNPMVPASMVVPPSTPALAFLQRHASDGRIHGLERAIPDDASTIYGLRDVRGYDAPQPTFRFFRLWQVMGPESEPYGSAPFTESTAKVTGLLGARYLVTPPGVGIGGTIYRLEYQGPDAMVYANRLAVPRAFVASRVEVEQGENEESGVIAGQGFDPRYDAVVRSDDVGGTSAPQGGGGTVRVVGDRNSEVTLRASLPRPGLVVLDDTWADGWGVRVDGHPARALRTDIVLRGVIVPAGAHRIAWSYRVPGLRLGFALSAFGLLLSLAWAGWLLIRRRAARSRGIRGRASTPASGN